MNSQRVSNAVSAIHRWLGSQQFCVHKSTGCDPDCLHLTDQSACNSLDNDPFNTLNYSDDFAGAELQFIRSNLSFLSMGTLLEVPNLAESTSKVVSPCQQMI